MSRRLRKRLLVLLSLKFHQPPPITLIRSPFRPRPTEISKPMRFPQLRPPVHTYRRLRIVLLRLRRRPTPLGQPEHVDLRRHAVQHEAQPIAHPHVVSRLHPLPIDMHLAPAHCLRSQRTRLEEPRTPQPLINAVSLRSVVFRTDHAHEHTPRPQTCDATHRRRGTPNAIVPAPIQIDSKSSECP